MCINTPVSRFAQGENSKLLFATNILLSITSIHELCPSESGGQCGISLTVTPKII